MFKKLRRFLKCLRLYFCLQPEVIVDFIFEDGLLFVAIKNIGPKAAYNIAVQFNPAFNGVEGKNVAEQALFKSTLFLPPGKEIRTFVDSSHSYFEHKQPLHIIADVFYENKSGQKFEETIQHNLEIYQDIAYTRIS